MEDIDGQERPWPVTPSEAADAVIGIGWDHDGHPNHPPLWTVVFGMPDGSIRTMRDLDYRGVRQAISHRWALMTDEVEAGRRRGMRKVRGRWIMSERCDDGVVRVFTAADKPAGRQYVRPSLATQTRFTVLSRDGYRCRYCGDGPEGVKLHVDHVQPRSKGGSDDLDNLVTACESCNMGKLDREGVVVP